MEEKEKERLKSEEVRANHDIINKFPSLRPGDYKSRRLSHTGQLQHYGITAFTPDSDQPVTEVTYGFVCIIRGEFPESEVYNGSAINTSQSKIKESLSYVEMNIETIRI